MLRGKVPNGPHASARKLLAEHQPIDAGFQHAFDGIEQKVGRRGDVRCKDKTQPAARFARTADNFH